VDADIVFDSLLPEIPSHCHLAVTLSHSEDEITIRPKLAPPQLISDRGRFLEDVFRCDAFDCLHKALRQHHGNGLHQEMNVVFVGAYLKKMYIIALSDSQARFLENGLSRLVNDYVSIFGRTYNVINHYTGIVALANINAH